MNNTAIPKTLDVAPALPQESEAFIDKSQTALTPEMINMTLTI